MKLWIAVFALLIVALSVQLVLQVRENRELRQALEHALRTRARQSGFEAGHTLTPATLRDAQGREVALEFAGAPGTLLLVFASGCDACEATAPVWRDVVASAGRGDVSVVVAQTDGQAERVDLTGLPVSLSVPLPPAGWLADLPAVPATLVLDAHGTIQRAWFGLLEGDAPQELLRALGEVGL